MDDPIGGFLIFLSTNHIMTSPMCAGHGLNMEHTAYRIQSIILGIYNNIILYANFFDNSAISLVNVDVVFFSNFS